MPKPNKLVSVGMVTETLFWKGLSNIKIISWWYKVFNLCTIELLIYGLIQLLYFCTIHSINTKWRRLSFGYTVLCARLHTLILNTALKQYNKVGS